MLPRMRVTETIGPAWERMKALLFRPFNAGTWFSFGFIFFLQSCVEGGGGGNFNVPGGGGNSGGSGGGYDGSSSGSSSDSIVAPFTNLMHSDGGMPAIGGAEIALILVIGLVVAIPLILLAYWLGARGQAMAIRAVAWGDSTVGMNWTATQGPGGRLFKFHLAIVGITAAILVPFMAIGAVLMIPAIEHHDGFETILVPLILLGVVAVLALIPLAIVNGITRNFLAPIMVKHEIGSREAWKRFWAIGRNHVGGIFVFFILKFLFSMLAAIAGMIGGFLTCCLGFLPVLQQTLMAPWHVFERAWSLEILASMSPDFDLRAQLPQQQYGPGGFGPPGGYGGPPGGFGPPGGDYNPYAPPAGGFGGPPPPAGGYGVSGGGAPPAGYGPPGTAGPATAYGPTAVAPPAGPPGAPPEGGAPPAGAPGGYGPPGGYGQWGPPGSGGNQGGNNQGGGGYGPPA